MALVMPSWFVRGRARPMFCFGSPSMLNDREPELQMRPSCNGPSTARVVQWAETPDAHIFKLFQSGLRKEEVQIHLEDDQITLYISYSNQRKAEGGEEQNSSFMRKLKLPETADLEQIRAEVMNEALTVTIPKVKPKTWAPRKIDITGAEAAQ